MEPLLAANLLAVAMAPADGKSELWYLRSLIMRSSKNEQFVVSAITQIAGVGGGGGRQGGGGQCGDEVTHGVSARLDVF